MAFQYAPSPIIALGRENGIDTIAAIDTGTCSPLRGLLHQPIAPNPCASFLARFFPRSRNLANQRTVPADYGQFNIAGANVAIGREFDWISAQVQLAKPLQRLAD